MRARALFALLVGGCGGGLPDGVELPTSDRTELAAVGLLESRCSATAIDVGGSADAPAYLLTAGHCTGFYQLLHPHVIDADYFKLGTVHFGLFTDTEDATIDIPTVERLYSSVLGADLGLYRLDATVGDLRARGIEPIALADAPPAAGEPIAIAGYPAETEDDPRRVLHLSHCEQGDTVRLAEGNIVFVDFLQDDCNSVRDGSSGGAVLDEDGRLFAVDSTKTEGPTEPCTLDHPCEVDGEHPVTDDGAVYTAPIRALADCFVDGVFDLEHAGCSLTRPRLPVVAEELLTDDAVTRWNVALEPTFPYYRTKAGLATEVRCEDDAGFGAPFAAVEPVVISDPIPAEPAGEPYVLCIQGLDDATATARDRFLDRTTMVQITR